MKDEETELDQLAYILKSLNKCKTFAISVPQTSSSGSILIRVVKDKNKQMLMKWADFVFSKLKTESSIYSLSYVKETIGWYERKKLGFEEELEQSSPLHHCTRKF